MALTGGLDQCVKAFAQDGSARNAEIGNSGSLERHLGKARLFPLRDISTVVIRLHCLGRL